MEQEIAEIVLENEKPTTKIEDQKITYMKQMAMLKKSYPVLALFVMLRAKRTIEARLFKEQCKELDGLMELSSVLVHAFWVPWLEEQRKSGLLKIGKILSVLKF